MCLTVFTTEEMMLKHIDEQHFYSCPICESIFLRSFDKKHHMMNNHEVQEEDAASDTLEELEFRQQINRHSTLTRTVNYKFVGDAIEVITDLKKHNRRPRGS